MGPHCHSQRRHVKVGSHSLERKQVDRHRPGATCGVFDSILFKFGVCRQSLVLIACVGGGLLFGISRRGTCYGMGGGVGGDAPGLNSPFSLSIFMHSHAFSVCVLSTLSK